MEGGVNALSPFYYRQGHSKRCGALASPLKLVYNVIHKIPKKLSIGPLGVKPLKGLIDPRTNLKSINSILFLSAIGHVITSFL